MVHCPLFDSGTGSYQITTIMNYLFFYYDYVTPQEAHAITSTLVTLYGLLILRILYCRFYSYPRYAHETRYGESSLDFWDYLRKPFIWAFTYAASIFTVWVILFIDLAIIVSQLI